MIACGRRLAVLVGVGAALVLPASAQAVERFASPTGSGTACTEPPTGTPCDLQTAVESASNGDVVTVLPGSYTATANPADRLDIIANIVVRGAPGQARPVLTSASTVGGIFIQAGGTLRRFELVYTDPATASGLSVLNGTVDQVVVHMTSPAGGQACQIAEGSIRDSVCWHSGGPGRGLTVSRNGVGTTTAVLRNDTLIGSGPTGIGLLVAGLTDGVQTANATNVIADGTAFDIRIQTAVGTTPAATLNIDHSNFNFASVDIVDGPGTETFNPISPNQDAATTPPLFDDAPNGDFQQTALSPTINQGVGGVVYGLGLGSADFDAEPRCMGTAPDIGADEFTAPECDADGDGVPDVIDACPATAGSASTNGCPDGDGDGVPDASDNCPAESGPASNNGCPVIVPPPDTDGDGIPDSSDACPTQAAPGTSNGCPTVTPPPPDSDKPQTKIDKGPNGEIESETATFKFSSDEQGSKFECRLVELGGGGKGNSKAPKFKSCTSPRKLKNLDPGEYRFEVRATDAAGNTDSTPAKRKFEVVEEERDRN